MRRFHHLALLVVPFVAHCGSVVESSVAAHADATLVAACKDLVAKRTAYEQLCHSWTDPAGGDAPVSEAVDACLGIVTAPGSLLTVDDVRACSAKIAAGCALGRDYPKCTGSGRYLLSYEDHDKKGTRKPGDPCILDTQCESARCSSLGDACGVCQAARAVGEACSGPHDVCVDAGASCVGGVCGFPGFTLGQSCLSKGDPCAAPLFCDEAAGAAAVCTPRGTVGEGCDAAKPCLDALQCLTGVCATPLPDGAQCPDGGCVNGCVSGACTSLQPAPGHHPNDDCSQTDDCVAGLQCNGTVCVLAPQAPLGAACPEGSNNACAAGLVCDSSCGLSCSSYTCVPEPTVGEPCTVLGACGVGAACEGWSPGMGQRGTCKKQGGEGDACPCRRDLTCLQGACTAFAAATCG
jgi:hypothetical protein